MNNRVLIITQDVNADLARKIQDILPDWEVLIGSDLNAWRNRVREAEVIVGWRKEMENLFEDGVALPFLAAKLECRRRYFTAKKIGRARHLIDKRQRSSRVSNFRNDICFNAGVNKKNPYIR